MAHPRAPKNTSQGTTPRLRQATARSRRSAGSFADGAKAEKAVDRSRNLIYELRRRSRVGDEANPKLQAPNPNHSQLPNPKSSPKPIPNLRLGVDLGFGAWDLTRYLSVPWSHPRLM